MNQNIYRKYIKRPLDFLISLIAFVGLSPLVLFLIIILRINNKGSAFFYQKRPGKNAKIFKIIKFKTMTDEVDSNGELLPDEDRLTKVGIFIRKTSLDEIPQLLNVIKGDMSIVGPRPLLPEYLDLYSDFQNRRHEVRPGITGWAQVNGRNAIAWEEKFKYDVWYTINQSFTLDLKIILLTIKKVIASEDINKEGTATTTKFTGSK